MFGGGSLESSRYSEIRELLKRNYNISPMSVQRIKGVYKVQSAEGFYCLKLVEYKLPHFLFILGAIRHLRDNGFIYGPEVIKTVEGMEYIELDGIYAYLMPWLKGRECSYDNLIELYMASIRLGELHKASEGFMPCDNMRPRVGWFKWVEVFRTRMNEILDFKYKILSKPNKSDVDKLYLDMIPKEIERCCYAIENLENSGYDLKMMKDIKKSGFCQHDYAHHNVMICENGINVIDFDYCILDSYIHDLASLMMRAMKYGNWDQKRAGIIIRAYNTVHEVAPEDIAIMSAFMEFPQDFWQRGIQYYWEKQPWGEEFFIKKLISYRDDMKVKEGFIREFRNQKLSNIIGGKS